MSEDKTSLPTQETHTTTDPPATPEMPEYEPVPFRDRLTAFALLILPWSFLMDWLQELLKDQVSSYVNNMIVLVGIVIFLVLVGTVSRRIYEYRKQKNAESALPPNG